MNTLIDIIVLLLAYAGISLGCSALLWALRVMRARPKHTNLEQVTSRRW